jgi:hypothetical protein
LPSETLMPGIGFSAVRKAFSTCFWLRLRSLGLVSWMLSCAEVAKPLPVSPTVVETMRISGKVATTSSTWRSLSLPRERLVPTGSSTFIWM